MKITIRDTTYHVKMDKYQAHKEAVEAAEYWKTHEYIGPIDIWKRTSHRGNSTIAQRRMPIYGWDMVDRTPKPVNTSKIRRVTSKKKR